MNVKPLHVVKFLHANRHHHRLNAILVRRKRFATTAFFGLLL